MQIHINIFNLFKDSIKRYTVWTRNNEREALAWELTLRFLTNEAVLAIAALFVVPFPSEVEVVVIGQNGAKGFISYTTQPLFILKQETQGRSVPTRLRLSWICS